MQAELFNLNRFACIYADPPWAEAGGGRRGAQNHYDLMTSADIVALPVKFVTAQNAHLWLWVTNNFLHIGLEAMHAWGFRYVTNRCWDKQVKGLGQYFRSEHELLLFGVRGTLPVPEPKFRVGTMIRQKRTEHSVKPDIYSEIEGVSPGPRLEMFARRPRDGWIAIGNEAPGRPGEDIGEALCRLAIAEPSRTIRV